MDHKEILSHVDHTLLKPEATWPQVQALCDEAVAYGTASVCINTCYVRQAAAYLAGRCKVCCVVGFPLGAMDTASKAFEARTAIANGADEVDMVINIGRLKKRRVRRPCGRTSGPSRRRWGTRSSRSSSRPAC